MALELAPDRRRKLTPFRCEEPGLSGGAGQGCGTGSGRLRPERRDQARFLKRQFSRPVSTISQWWVRRSRSAVAIFWSMSVPNFRAGDLHAPGRGAAHPVNLLTGYRGRFLQCDGYDVHDKVAALDRPEGRWQIVHCWAHVRRRFVKRVQSEGSPVAEEGLRRIALLYAVEAQVRCKAPEVASPPVAQHRRRSSPP